MSVLNFLCTFFSPAFLISHHSLAVASMVKQALQDALVQILQPKRRVDILRDVLEAQAQHKPFVITFCGVNGVGKSTNLAKVRTYFAVFFNQGFWEISICLDNCFYRRLIIYTDQP